MSPAIHSGRMRAFTSYSIEIMPSFSENVEQKANVAIFIFFCQVLFQSASDVFVGLYADVGASSFVSVVTRHSATIDTREIIMMYECMNCERCQLEYRNSLFISIPNIFILIHDALGEKKAGFATTSTDRQRAASTAEREHLSKIAWLGDNDFSIRFILGECCFCNFSVDASVNCY